MKRHYACEGIALAECTNKRLGKWIVRWDVQPLTDAGETGTAGETGGVSFVQQEFMRKPLAGDLERAVAQSGLDASDDELQQIATQLGYDGSDFAAQMDEARRERIAQDPQAQMMEIVRESRSAKTDLTDAQVLATPAMLVGFDELCSRGTEVAQGVAFRYRNKPWRVVQAHTPQRQYPPGEYTGSLYTKINVQHAGTLEDPIPYEQMMAIDAGKYYTQYGVTYVGLITTQTGYPNDLMYLTGVVQEV